VAIIAHSGRRVTFLFLFSVMQVEESLSAEYEVKARVHIPHDPDDWSTVALSLALGIGIWTEDWHGLALWWTDPLRAYRAAADAN